MLDDGFEEWWREHSAPGMEEFKEAFRACWNAGVLTGVKSVSRFVPEEEDTE